MGIWIHFAENLRPRLLHEGPITMTIEEIIAATHTTDKDIRLPSWWKAVKHGDPYMDTLAKRNITCDYTLSPDNKVTAVTFHLVTPNPASAH